MTATARQSSQATVLSLAQLLEQQPPSAPPCLVEPGLLPQQGILFVGGEPKVGKSLLVANLALALAAGSNRAGFSIPAPRRQGEGEVGYQQGFADLGLPTYKQDALLG